MLLPTHPIELTVENSAGERLATFQVEIASTPTERATGLMFREDFGGDAAMLFAFGEPRRISMWMKNTPSPLDMLFAGANGQILAIERNTEPFSLAIIAPNVASDYVLEIGAGEAAKRNISIGDWLRHPTIPKSML